MRGPETYFIPSEIDAIRRLPEPERGALLRTIRAREANLGALRETDRRFVKRVNSGKFFAVPEYAMELGKVLMSVDFDNPDPANPLHFHEPLFHARPPYTRVVLLAPAALHPRIQARLQEIGMSQRVRLVANQDASNMPPGQGVTRWVRDVLVVVRDDRRTVLLASLAHKDYTNVADYDLAFLKRVADANYDVVRMPIFLRGGNVAVAVAGTGRTVLLVGRDELKMNEQWFVEAFGFRPAPGAVQDIFKAATGAAEVVVLPNSRGLYHVDMFAVPLGDGVVGVLDPVDAERLPPTDRDVLARTREALQRLGFRIVPIPTSYDRIRRYQSSTNIVPFTDRNTGRRRALVPVFPEPAGPGGSSGLNARVLDAYRSAGIEPTPVEERFHTRWGNTHCAMVPMQ